LHWWCGAGGLCGAAQEDGGKVHLACLRAYLDAVSRRDEDAREHRCPVCGQKYQIRLQYKLSLDWATLCTCQVINNCFELTMLAATLAATLFAYSLLDMKELESEGGTAAAILLAVMSVLCLAAVVMAFRTVWSRLQKSASELVVEEGIV
jgi:hypothetical protein